jgi:hypothetical protein
MATRKYYRPDRNPGTEANPAMLPGVPLADLSDEEYEAFPEWLQRSIDASEMYQSTNPHPQPRRAARSDDEKEG